MAGKKKTPLQVNDLFALSDALGMPLDLYNNGTITGKLNRTVVIPEISLKMNMEIKVERSMFEWGTKKGTVEPRIVLLVHVIGDLYVLAANDRLADEVICMVIDGDKVPRYANETVKQGVLFTFDDMKKQSAEKIIKAFLKWSVAEFKRGQYDTEWKEAA
jgi:hypothetical protein